MASRTGYGVISVRRPLDAGESKALPCTNPQGKSLAKIVCGWIVSPQALLFAVGLNATTAIPAAAALNWVIKDGLGQFGGMFFASLVNKKFDADPKKWRLVAGERPLQCFCCFLFFFCFLFVWLKTLQKLSSQCLQPCLWTLRRLWKS